MTFLSKISGVGGSTLGQVLRDELMAGEAAVLGVVSAFVSVGGFRDLLTITRRRKSLECRLLAGISSAITHPQALTEALGAGWDVRLGSATGRAIFHPKMILSGRSFRRDGSIKELSFAYVGSSNLTKGGLHNNIECGVIAHADFASPSLVSCFATLWNAGEKATPSRIHSYAEEFAKRNRQRLVDDIEALGVSDTVGEEKPTYAGLIRKRAATKREVIPESVAGASWAGLESFTGEYQFQVEFPQSAGLILNRIIRRGSHHRVPILCTEDNTIRDMSYRFYPDNGMFRLNIPNDTPGVGWARQSHRGIVLVEASDRSDVAGQLTIVTPGSKLEEIVRRSFLLDTWGSTRTRIYGWY